MEKGAFRGFGRSSSTENSTQSIMYENFLSVKVEWLSLVSTLEVSWLLCLTWRYMNYATSHVCKKEKYKMSDKKNRKLRIFSS